MRQEISLVKQHLLIDSFFSFFFTFFFPLLSFLFQKIIEPLLCPAKYEGCGYTLDGYVEFVGKYLGPTVKPAFPSLKILAYDWNRGELAQWTDALHSSPTASQYVDGIATHWYDYGSSLNLDQLDAIKTDYPLILSTEACYLQSLTFGWEVGAIYMADILGVLNHGSTGWVFWNSLLLTGMNLYIVLFIINEINVNEL